MSFICALVRLNAPSLTGFIPRNHVIAVGILSREPVLKEKACDRLGLRDGLHGVAGGAIPH
jgi:hypothetical protein